MTITALPINELQAQLQSLLEQHNRHADVELFHDPSAFVASDEWVHLVVQPEREGLRAYDYVLELGILENKLREATGFQEVLLVPAITT